MSMGRAMPRGGASPVPLCFLSSWVGKRFLPRASQGRAAPPALLSRGGDTERGVGGQRGHAAGRGAPPSPP